MKLRATTLPAAWAAFVLSAPAALAGIIVNAPVDVIGHLPAAEFAADGYATGTYKDWGNESSVAVNPTNLNDLFVSSFANGTSSTSGGANVFFSTTAGSSWTSQFSVPAPSNGLHIPNDWTFSYDAGGRLHGAVLGGCGVCNIYHGSTADPTSLAAWTYTGGGTPINTAASLGTADQPWIALGRGAGTGKVFVAYDDFHSGVAERVAVSSDNGASFTVDNQINNGPQPNPSVNPGTRIAADANGTIYGIFGVGTPTPIEGVHNVTYYLNRSRDGGVTWDFNGSSAVGGILIDSGLSSQLDDAGTQSSNNWFAHVNDLRGNITAIASDKTGAHVYVLIGKQDSAGTDRIYLVEYNRVGASLVPGGEIVVSPANERSALPSITVKDDGTVVLMYQTFGGDGQVHVHVASSSDFGATIADDVVEYSFAPLPLSQVAGPGANREFGDYAYLTSVGNTFYGAFAGLGNVDANGIDTTGLIDPFFFSGFDARAVPEAGSLSVLLAGLLGLGAVRLRRRGGQG